jgi:hypothetical protein
MFSAMNASRDSMSKLKSFDQLVSSPIANGCGSS